LLDFILSIIPFYLIFGLFILWITVKYASELLHPPLLNLAYGQSKKTNAIEITKLRTYKKKMLILSRKMEIK